MTTHHARAAAPFRLRVDRDRRPIDRGVPKLKISHWLAVSVSAAIVAWEGLKLETAVERFRLSDSVSVRNAVRLRRRQMCGGGGEDQGSGAAPTEGLPGGYIDHIRANRAERQHRLEADITDEVTQIAVFGFGGCVFTLSRD